MAQQYRVIDRTRDVILAEASRKATNPISRGLGLIPRSSLPPGEGLIIEPCNSVVSFFMRFPIDVIFAGPDGEVRHVLHNMVPWRTSKIVRGTRYVVELPAGTAARAGVEVGDRLQIEPV